jgi:hypothetical protein
MALQFGILLALACAVATNVAFLYRHRGARAAPRVEARHPLRSARDLLATRWFFLGWLAAVVAWTLHVGALALAPMSVVQAVLAAGVAGLAVMAEPMFGVRVGRRQWAGLGLTAAGLMLLALTLPASANPHSRFSSAGMVDFEVALVAIGAVLIVCRRLVAVHRHGLMLGAASGVLFGVSDTSIKAITGLVGATGASGLVTPWLGVALCASVVAFYTSARGLQYADALAVIAATVAAATVAGIAGGVIVFGDPMPGDPLAAMTQVVAFVVICAATVLTPAPLRAARATA